MSRNALLSLIAATMLVAAPPTELVPYAILADLPQGDVWYRPVCPASMASDPQLRLQWWKSDYGSWRQIESVHPGQVWLFDRWLSPAELKEWEWTADPKPKTGPTIVKPCLKVVAK